VGAREVRVRGGRGDGLGHAGADLRARADLARARRRRRRAHRPRRRRGLCRRAVALVRPAGRRAPADARASDRQLPAPLPARERVSRAHRVARRCRMNAARYSPHAKAFGWGVAEYVAYPACMLVATPLFLAALGADGYGLLLLAGSVTSLAGASGLGMGAATIRFVAQARGTGDVDGTARVVRHTLALSLLVGAPDSE